MVDRAFRRQFDFIKTQLDYKSNDLEYRLLEEDYKKTIRKSRCRLTGSYGYGLGNTERSES